MNKRINPQKSVIKNQNYEEYWKVTLALTAFFDEQFRRTLKIIIDHIDEYKLAEKKDSELIKDLHLKKKSFNPEIVKNKELENKIFQIYPNDSLDKSSTRKQINTFIKLGFVKPYLKGYVPAAKEYVKSNKTIEELHRLFSDTVYNYASFNSSQVNDDSSINQVKFIVNTLLNREEKVLDYMDIVGLMNMDIKGKSYAKEKDLESNKRWAQSINFDDRKYNQIGHFLSILKNLNLFETTGLKNDFKIALVEDAKEYLPKYGDTKRDNYRFSLMKQAVYEDSLKVYGGKICWLTKQPQEGLTVSHIWASADALKEWDYDSAYDPNNALLLKPGDPDLYFDGKKMTFNIDGKPIFNEKLVREDFMIDAIKHNWILDEKILTPERLNYLSIHNEEFYDKLNK